MLSLSVLAVASTLSVATPTATYLPAHPPHPPSHQATVDGRGPCRTATAAAHAPSSAGGHRPPYFSYAGK